MLKILYIVLGSISLFLGVLGIFVPGLPTTPFVLLSAGLYVRSSDKLYKKLITHKYLGRYITDFYKKKGLSLITKITSLAMMWTMILATIFFIVEKEYVKYILIPVGLIGTIVMIFFIPTIKKIK